MLKTSAVGTGASRGVGGLSAARFGGLRSRLPGPRAMTYVELAWQEQCEVQVQHRDDRWYPGWLEAYRQDDGVWSGYVRYTTGLAETPIGWFEEGRIQGGALGRDD